MNTEKRGPSAQPADTATVDARLAADAVNVAVSVLEKAGAKLAAPIAISIISNSRLLQEGLAAQLALHLNLQVLATHPGDLQPAPSLPNPPRHVVLLDSNVGSTAATTCLAYWRKLTPPANVLVLELANDIREIMTYIETGASGYTLLGASTAEVAVAIWWICHGVAYTSPEVTAQLFLRLAALRPNAAQVTTHPLTSRELQVLHGIAQGYTNQEIAVELVIELRTVKQHVHNILTKLALHSRAEAVRLAYEKGWLRSALSSSNQT